LETTASAFKGEGRGVSILEKILFCPEEGDSKIL